MFKNVKLDLDNVKIVKLRKTDPSKESLERVRNEFWWKLGLSGILTIIFLISFIKMVGGSHVSNPKIVLLIGGFIIPMLSIFCALTLYDYLKYKEERENSLCSVSNDEHVRQISVKLINPDEVRKIIDNGFSSKDFRFINDELCFVTEVSNYFLTDIDSKSRFNYLIQCEFINAVSRLEQAVMTREINKERLDFQKYLNEKTEDNLIAKEKEVNKEADQNRDTVNIN